MTVFTREDCLSTVMKSPKAVAIHDKAAWMAIFARYNVVEDPVGSAPVSSGLYDARAGVRDNAPLGRFFDTFIKPMQLVFHVDQDVVCGMSVVRDMTIEIKMSPKVTVYAPMHAHYELMDESGELKVRRLAAHWELGPMLKQQMSFGLASMIAVMSATGRMITHLGFGGMLGFMKAVFNIGQTGKNEVAAFVEAFNQQQASRLKDLVSTGFRGVAWPANTPVLDLDQLLAKGGQLSLSKIMSSGNYVTATMQLEQEGVQKRGVAFFEFAMHEKKIERVAFHIESVLSNL